MIHTCLRLRRAPAFACSLVHVHLHQCCGCLTNVLMGMLTLLSATGWFSLNVPSGLTLYWFTNNLLSTGQQVHFTPFSGGSMPLSASSSTAICTHAWKGPVHAEMPGRMLQSPVQRVPCLTPRCCAAVPEEVPASTAACLCWLVRLLTAKASARRGS